MKLLATLAGYGAAALLPLVLGGCAGPAGAPRASTNAIARAAAPVDALGIVVHGLHLSAHGYILDLRYRITDPRRAAALLDSKSRIQLLDPRRGAALGIPESPVIGPMRQTARNHVLYQDRDYFVLFVNPAHAVQAGEMLALAIDGKAVAQLRVE
jgi:hypothetical protein